MKKKDKTSYHREYYKKNKKIILKKKKLYSKKNKDLISTNKKIYYTKNKIKLSIKNKKYREKNKIFLQKKNKERYETGLIPIERILYNSAKRRAKEKGLDFNIDKNDIKVFKNCPLLRIKLIRGKEIFHDGSPTIDRINNKKGYVKGNVHVISHKANRMKNNSTLGQLKTLVKNLEKLEKKIRK